jgi:predicted nucleic acid-binding protein
MKPTVYIETTVPSYYCDERPEIAADIARTREWWDQERDAYECFISPVVLDELLAGNYPGRSRCLKLIEDLAVLALNPDIVDIAEVYQVRRLMPKEPVRDALHIACASYYRMDYLLTWNCRHLANANKVRHLEMLNQSMGLHVPLLVTPYMLQPWEPDDERG